MFPLRSCTKSVTLLAAAVSAQVKLVMSSHVLSTMQLSDEPLSNVSGPMTALPVESRYMVMLLVRTTGGCVSSTVTCAMADAMFPLASRTNRVTLFTAAVSPQLKAVMSSHVLSTTQLSEEPLSTVS